MTILVFKVTSTQKFAPDLRIVNSSSDVDRNHRSAFPFKIKPDISVYPAESDPDVKTDSALAEIFIELKWNPIDDPFCDVRDIKCPHCTEDTVKSFLHDTESAIDTLGQITAYAAAQLSSHSSAPMSIPF